MELQQFPVLSILLLLPLLGLVVVLAIPSRSTKWLRIGAVAAAMLPLALSIWLYVDYDKVQGHFDYREQADWVSVPLHTEVLSEVGEAKFSFQYAVGIDGMSLSLLLLTTIVTAMAGLAAVQIKKRRKAFYAWFFILEFAMLGVFMAQDLFLFFIFFEITLVAAYFLIGIWGFFNREKAANQFLIYNGIGSAVMLVAFVILVNTAGFRMEDVNGVLHMVYSGSYNTIIQQLSDPAAWANMPPVQAGGIHPFYLTDGMKWTMFTLLLVAFGIKLPVFPFHTWMLKVHKEAPHPVVMIHSAILLKMGAYGLLRYGVLLFPEQAKAGALTLAILGLVNLLYGAWLAFRQQDFKLVLAYSSVSHMGIVLLGIAAMNEIGMQGAIVQMVSHGLISALLFLIVGTLYERTETTELSKLGGLARSMPFMSGMLLAAGLALAGIPGLSGFIGELLALLGVMESMKPVAIIGAAGLVLTAVYVMRSVLRITYGKQPEWLAAKKDVRLIEALPMIILLSFIVLLGCYPSVLTDKLDISATAYIQHLLTLRTGG